MIQLDCYTTIYKDLEVTLSQRLNQTNIIYIMRLFSPVPTPKVLTQSITTAQGPIWFVPINYKAVPIFFIHIIVYQLASCISRKKGKWWTKINRTCCQRWQLAMVMVKILHTLMDGRLLRIIHFILLIVLTGLSKWAQQKIGLSSTLIGSFQSFSCHLEVIRGFTYNWNKSCSCSPSQISIKTAMKKQDCEIMFWIFLEVLQKNLWKNTNTFHHFYKAMGII